MEMVSKENRESGRGQWCILFPLSSREGVCYGGKHVCTMGWGTKQRCGVREEAAGGGVGNP